MSATNWPLPAKNIPILKGDMPNSAFRDEGIPSLIAVQKSSCKQISVPAMKSVRRVEFDEDSIKATSPIRNARPTDNKTLSIRTLQRSDSQETIMPTPRRTRSKDVFEPAVDETHNTCKSSSTDEGSPATKGTHLLRKSTSMENVSPTVSPTIRRMRSALSIKSTSPRAAIKALQPRASSLLQLMCFFNPSDIQQQYLNVIGDSYSSDTGISVPLLSDFPVQPNDLQSALDELMKEELISFPAYSLGMRVKDEVRNEILNQLKSMPDIFEVAFQNAVFVLHKLWPSMMPSTLKSQQSELDFDEYAKDNLWGGRNELVKHVEALESLFQEAKDDTRLLCASTRYFALLVEAAWYYLERANYPAANQLGEAALFTSKLACMMPRSLLANLYRARAALDFELGRSDRVEIEAKRFKELYHDSFPQSNPTAVRDWRHGCPTASWVSTADAIVQSGLLAAAPDGVGLSPWGFDGVEGFPDLAPFLSLRYFGWVKIAEGRYEDAARCFLQGLGDLKRFGPEDSVGPRGELLYALGVVREAQKKDRESFRYFERALDQFQKKDDSGPSVAKTHYKMARYYIHRVERYHKELRLALDVKELKFAELDPAKLNPAQKELLVQSISELRVADDHLEAATAFYSHHGNKNEYGPHLARVWWQSAQVWTLFGMDDGELKEVFETARRYREKMCEGIKKRREVMITDFDAEVVIWAR